MQLKWEVTDKMDLGWFDSDICRCSLCSDICKKYTISQRTRRERGFKYLSVACEELLPD